MCNFIVFAFLIWLLNLELNPTLGNIWWRTCEDGNRHLNIKGLVHVLMSPFYDKRLWLPRFWDFNPYMFIPTCILLKYVIQVQYVQTKEKNGSL